MSSVVIVGAGLFGSGAAALARKAGHKVTVIDSAEVGRASICSGNLFKRSWLASLTKDEVRTAFSVLDTLYGVTQLEEVGLSWVDTRLVLLPPDMSAKVDHVGDGFVRVGRKTLRGKVLVAAGVWSGSLVEMPSIRRLCGASLRIRGQVSVPRSATYAPYKQVSAYNLNAKTIWAGDGAAILEANWNTVDRVKLLKARVASLGVSIEPSEVRVGMRPYVPGYKNGYFAQVHGSTWVSTGGAKNGLVLSALLAQKFVEGL